MRRFWSSVVKPIFEKENIRNIVEIGSDHGENTANLLQYVKEHGGHLDAIDPFPSFPAEEWEEKSEGTFTMHRDLSLNVIPKLDNDKIDVYLIDGDHNWYTVYNELCSIKKYAGGKFPLILFHDIGWPYAYRDLYYNPDNIPPEYRQPYAKKGIKYGNSELSDEGINSHLLNAASENGERNGVRTAVDDFLKDNPDLGLCFYSIEIINGLGMIADPDAHKEAVRIFTASDTLSKVIEMAEKERIDLHQKYDTARKLVARINTKAFFDYGSGFSKDTSVSVSGYDEKTGALNVRVEAPSIPAKLRFDPVDGMYCIVSDLKVSTDNGMLPISRHNGHEIGGSYFFDHYDPQFIFNNERKARVFNITAHIVHFSDPLMLSSVVDYINVTKQKRRLSEEIEKLKRESFDLSGRNKKLENDCKALTAKNQQLTAQNQQLTDQAGQYVNAAQYYKAEAELHYNSFRYRIGSAFVDSYRSPKKLFKLPFVLRNILKEYKKTGSRKLQYTPQALPPGSLPGSIGAPGKLGLAASTNSESSVPVYNQLGLYKLKNYDFCAFEEKYKRIREQRVDIIIPVYNAYEDLCECLDTLFRYTDFPYHLTLINDCSPDERIMPLLEKYRDMDNVSVYSNEQNLGFVGTVNFGITHTKGDVVFLNSDTKLTPHWLRKLVIASCANEKTATVTPFSNAAGAFSVPEMGKNDDIPDGISLNEMSRLVESCSSLDYVNVPTGNGFCMYVTRDALDKVGLLDIEAFAKGYGEENDFCMRAKGMGFNNLICDEAYVYHHRSASFKEEKNELIQSHRKILDERYPTYSQEIGIFKNSPALTDNRSRIADALRENDGVKYQSKRILYVLHEGTGGTPKTNEDLMSFVSAQYDDVFLLTSDTVEFKLYQMENGALNLIYSRKVETEWNVKLFHCEEYRNIYFDVLQNMHIQLVHVRHLFKHSMDIIDVANEMDIPIVFSLHDFYMICPTINLINSDGKYCNAECRDCDKKCVISTPMIQLDEPTNTWTKTVWQKNSAEIFARCSRLITTSDYSRDLFVRVFPETAEKFSVIEHGRDFNYARKFLGSVPDGQKVRILLAGNINYNKGEDFIIALKKADKDNKLDIHIIGGVFSETLRNIKSHVKYHGKYKREEFAERVSEIKPSYIGIFSIWPETYCHVLTEAWSCGIPCIVSDIGTLKERAEKHGGCILADLNDPVGTYKKILSVSADKEKYKKLADEAVKAPIRSINEMGSYYELIYDDILNRKKRPAVFWLAERQDKYFASTYIRIISPIMRNRVLRENALVLKVKKTADIPKLNGERQMTALIQRDRIDQDSIESLKDQKADGSDIMLFFEIDDDLIGIDRKHEHYAKYSKTIDKIRDLSEISDKVLTTSKIIAGRFDNSVVIPNYIDSRLWGDIVLKEHAEKPIIRILYSGTMTHGNDLRLMRSVMNDVNKKLSAHMLRAELCLVGVTTEFEGWFTKIEVPEHLTEYPNFINWLKGVNDFDIAIAPLALDSTLNKAKSNLKYLEYTMLGLPGVYTDTEAYSGTVKNGVNGFLIENNDPKAWSGAIVKLCTDPDLRSKMAKEAANDVRKNYILSDHYEEIADVFLKDV